MLGATYLHSQEKESPWAGKTSPVGEWEGGRRASHTPPWGKLDREGPHCGASGLLNIGR